MAEPSPTTVGLAALAEGLSVRLPGSWTVVAREHVAYADQFPLAERVWDRGHVNWVFGEFVLSRSAVLTSDAGAKLVVIERPRHKHEFLVAALWPHGLMFTEAVEAPHGIVVDADPARAAPAVAERLLPRYEQAVRQVQIEQLAAAVNAGERVLAEWDAVSDSLCDADHWPLDERYDLRQRRRDAEMWAQFAPFLDYGPALVARAEETLPLLDPADRAEGRWPYRLRVLREVLEGGARVQGEFEAVADALVPEHPRAEAALAKAVAERDAEGWYYAVTWMENGGALVEMARAERGQQGRPARSTRVEAARARSPHVVPRSAPGAVVSAAAPPPGVGGHGRRPRSR